MRNAFLHLTSSFQTLSQIWDTFMDYIEPFAARVPYMIGVGNHEYDYGKGSERDPSGAAGPYEPDWGNFGA